MQIMSNESICPIRELIAMLIMFGGFIPLLICLYSSKERPIVITVSTILISIGCIMFIF